MNHQPMQNYLLNSANYIATFGSPIASRAYASGEYGYGFNGMEKDDALNGNGNAYDFGARILDNRLGRWFSLDPLMMKYPGLSDFCFVANSPIFLIDNNGEKIWIYYKDDRGKKQKAEYKDGQIFNPDGTKYEGNNAFVLRSKTYLDKVNSTEVGQKMINKLCSSNHNYDMVDENPKKSRGMRFAPYKKGGGKIYAGYLNEEARKGKNPKQQTSFDMINEASKIEGLSNELYHAFQVEFGDNKMDLNSEFASDLVGLAVLKSIGGFDVYISLYYEDQYGNDDNAKELIKSIEDLMTSKTFDNEKFERAVDLFSKTPRGQKYIERGKEKVERDENPAVSELVPLKSP